MDDPTQNVITFLLEFGIHRRGPQRGLRLQSDWPTIGESTDRSDCSGTDAGEQGPETGKQNYQNHGSGAHKSVISHPGRTIHGRLPAIVISFYPSLTMNTSIRHVL